MIETPNSSVVRLIPACVGAVALLALNSGCTRDSNSGGPAAASAPPVSVQTIRVRRGEATRSIVLPANVVAYQQATLYAKVAGYVKTVAVDKGDEVSAGAPLADIEVPELIADHARYKAELEIAALDYQRTSDAQAKAPDLIVRQAVDTARSKFDVAKANLDRTETLLGYARITAPFAGIITRRLVDPGAFIPAATSGTPAQNAALFTLMDFSKVRVQVAVPENEVPFIQTNLAVKLTVDELPDREFDCSVTRYAYALDDTAKTMLAECEVANPDRALRPGMYAAAQITVQRKPDALILPATAIFTEKNRNSVFTIANGHAKKTPVKTGFSDNGIVEILGGVAEHEPVIALGKQVLSDGQAVTVAGGK